MESDKRDVLERILDYDTCTDYDIDEAAQEIKRLRSHLAAMQKQRDEARREVCDMVARTRRKMGVRGQIVGMDRVAGEEVAAERGWNCYEGKDINA